MLNNPTTSRPSLTSEFAVVAAPLRLDFPFSDLGLVFAGESKELSRP